MYETLLLRISLEHGCKVMVIPELQCSCR